MSSNKLWVNPLKIKEPVFQDNETYNPIQNALPHDLSIVKYDRKTKKITFEKCLLSTLILTKTELKDNVFFKDKLPIYFDLMHKAKQEKKHTYELLDNLSFCLQLNDIIENQEIKTIIGFNASFDYDSTNRLYDRVNDDISLLRKNHELLKISYKDIPRKIYNGYKKVNYLDMYTMLTMLVKENKAIRLELYTFCVENHLYTDTLKCIKTSEEVFHRCFVDADTIEQHMGLQDCYDECELWKWLLQQVKKGKLKSKVTLNTKVSKANYGKYGLYSSYQVLRELEKENVDIDLSELKEIVATHF